MMEWRKDPEFSGAIKKATAQRLLLRLERVEAGEQGWQGTAWALERLYPHRFARPEVMNQIAVVNQGGNVSTERVIVLPGEEFDALIETLLFGRLTPAGQSSTDPRESYLPQPK